MAPNQPCQTGERLASVEAKLDAVKESQQEMRADLKELCADTRKNTEQLAEHMKRTELNEQALGDFRKKFFLVIGLFVMVETLKLGGVDGLVKVIPLITKLFGL